MAQYGKRDQYSDAPKFVVDAGTGQKGQEQFGNTVFLADGDEQAATAGIVHSGWQRRTVGRGGLIEVIVTTSGTGYANGDAVAVTNWDAGANAAGNVETDASGNIVSVSLTDLGGSFFSSPNVVITTAAGNNAVLTANVGGRAGRIEFETLVAMNPGSITTDATSFSNTSSSDVANTTGTADDTVLPDS